MSRSPRTALIAAAIGVIALAITWFCAFHVGFVEDFDLNALGGFTHLHEHPGHQSGVAYTIATLANPKPFAYMAFALVVLALIRGRSRLAVTVGIILVGANVTTHLLKPALAHGRPDQVVGAAVDAASWPSGHATASMSIVLCAILVAPSRRRPWVAVIGTVFTVAVVYSFLSLGWHFPTDVLGGYLMAATWTALGVAYMWAGDRAPRDAPSRRIRIPLATALRPAAAVLAVVGLVVAAVAIARPSQVVDYADGHTTFVVFAAVIAVLGLTLASGLAAALSGRASATAPRPAPTAALRRRWRRG